MNESERLFIWAKKPIVLFSLMAISMFSYFYIDKPVAMAIHQWDLSFYYWIIQTISAIGIVKIVLPTLLVLALFFRYQSNNTIYEARVWFLFLCVFIPNLVCVFLKIFLGRARPELLFEKLEYGFYGFHINSLYWSFPSGHTTTVVGLALGLAVIFRKFSFGLLVLALMTACSRIILLKHFISDVLVAATLTILIVGFFNIICHHKHWILPTALKKKEL